MALIAHPSPAKDLSCLVSLAPYPFTNWPEVIVVPELISGSWAPRPGMNMTKRYHLSHMFTHSILLTFLKYYISHWIWNQLLIPQWIFPFVILEQRMGSSLSATMLILRNSSDSGHCCLLLSLPWTLSVFLNIGPSIICIRCTQAVC